MPRTKQNGTGTRLLVAGGRSTWCAHMRVFLTQAEPGRARGLPAPPGEGGVSQSDSSLEAGLPGTLLGAALRVTYVPETQ